MRVGPLLGALGLGGLVLALALQKPVENFFAGVILQARRPFTVGDTVRLADHLGVVVDIDSRTTVLRSLDGTTIRIPNAKVTDGDIVNLTREGARRSTLVVGVSYDTDLDVATAALGIAISRVQRILEEPPPMVLLSGFGASSIDFTIYYWHTSDVPSELVARHDPPDRPSPGWEVRKGDEGAWKPNGSRCAPTRRTQRGCFAEEGGESQCDASPTRAAP